MMAAFMVAIRGAIKQAVMLGIAATISHTAIVWLIALGGMYISRQFSQRTDAADGFYLALEYRVYRKRRMRIYPDASPNWHWSAGVLATAASGSCCAAKGFMLITSACTGFIISVAWG